MSGAIIVIDQDRPSGISLGTAGVGRTDGWLGQTVRLSPATTNTSQQWDLLAKPAGSTQALIGSTTTACTFTPDVPGTYRIRLVTNGGGEGNVQIRVIRVRYSSTGRLLNHGLCLPAIGEEENEAPGGWDDAIQILQSEVIGLRTPGVATVADLRAIDETVLADRMLRIVAEKSLAYWFSDGTGANLADDGNSIVKPTSRTLSTPGRWYPLTQMPVFANVTALRAAASGVHSLAYTLDRGVYRWDASNVDTDDGVNVVRPTGLSTGAWVLSTAGGGGGGGIAVPNLTTLTGTVDDTALTEDFEIVVESVDEPFELHKTSTDTMDGITIVATKSGTGRWIRASRPSARWALVADWYVHEGTGDDERIGTSSGQALKTPEEIRRRLGRNTPKQVTTVHLLSDITTPTQLDIPAHVISGSLAYPLEYVGTRTNVVPSATLASFNVRDGTNANRITCGTITDWTPYIGNGHMIVMTSGAANAAVSEVGQDLGGGVAEVAAFINTSTLSEATPAPGDTFKIVKRSELWLYEGVVTLQSFQDIYFRHGFGAPSNKEGFVAASNASTQYLCCAFDEFFRAGSIYESLIACSYYSAQAIIQGGTLAFFGGLLLGRTDEYSSSELFVSGGADLEFQNGVLFCKCTLTSTDGANNVWVIDADFMNPPSGHPAMQAINKGQIRLRRAGGSGATTYGCITDETGKILIDTTTATVTVTGALGDVSINGVVRKWAAGSFIDAATEASLVVRGTPAIQLSAPMAPIVQTKFYINPSTGDDGAIGDDPSRPLKTGQAVTRRTLGGLWNQGLYEIFVVGDLLNPDFLQLSGTRLRNSSILVHGSVNRGQGRVVLYTSAGGISAKHDQARASNVRGDITDASAPWTSGSLVSTSSNQNRRLRLVDGSKAGALAFPQKDLTGGKVAVSQWILPASGISGPMTGNPPPEVVIDGTEHFVVEQLTHIDAFGCTIAGIDDDSTNSGGSGIVLESLDFGGSKTLAVASTDPVAFLGCSGVHYTSNISAMYGTIYVFASHVFGQSVNGPVQGLVYGCHQTGVFGPQSGARITFDGDTICEGSALFLARRGGAVRVGNAASFNSSTDGCQIDEDGRFRCDDVFAGAHRLWGSGAAQYGARVSPGASLRVASNVPLITGASGDGIVGGVPFHWGGTVDPFFPCSDDELAAHVGYL